MNLRDVQAAARRLADHPGHEQFAAIIDALCDLASVTWKATAFDLQNGLTVDGGVFAALVHLDSTTKPKPPVPETPAV